MEVRPSRRELRQRSSGKFDVKPAIERLRALVPGWRPQGLLGWGSLAAAVIGLALLGHVLLAQRGAQVAQGNQRVKFHQQVKTDVAALEKNIMKQQQTTPPGTDIPVAADMNQVSLAGFMFLKGTDSALVPKAGDEIGELTIPKIALDDIMLEGDSGDAMATGPIHVSQTALPGETGNMVIAGHNALYFEKIGALQPGDKVNVMTTSGTKDVYVVVRSEIVPASTSIPVYPYPASLTLETCYPLNGSTANPSQRYLVQARLAVPD